MRFLCPYCQHDLGPQPLAFCPRCARGIHVPDHLRNVRFTLRKRARQQRARQSAQEQKRRLLLRPGFGFGRKPTSILISMAVLALVGGVLIGRVKTTAVAARKTPQMLCQEELNIFRVALDDFRGDCGHYPDPKSGLMALINNPGLPQWKGPYVTLVKPDPWRHRYVYELTGDEPLVLSPGPDGRRGTADDLVPRNWQTLLDAGGQKASGGPPSPAPEGHKR